jgi:cell wall-associated NlpC family hydrolase
MSPLSGPNFRSLALSAVAAATIASPAEPQTAEGFDLSYGRWYVDSTAVIYAVGYYRQLLGPWDFGIALDHLDDSRSLDPRTLTGLQLSLGLGRLRSGFYATATAGLGMRQSDHNLDAHWSAGLGYGLRVLPFLMLGLEARYRVEDRWARGFWNLQTGDRKALSVGLRVAAGELRSSRRPPHQPAGPRFAPPSEGEIESVLKSSGASDETAALAAQVVNTALDAMGTPYRWGGSDDNGFDCSGLIQYAYAQHGILLPRASRDQIRMGLPVEPRLEALRPGDILGFSVERAGVTHVGLYVGNGQFIHSASGGVKLSSLTATDPDSRWWQQRLVAARRILN